MVIQGNARRLVLGLLVALLLVLFVREAVAQMIPTPEICRNTTPADWDWWANLCFNYPASGSSLMHSGFLVR